MNTDKKKRFAREIHERHEKKKEEATDGPEIPAVNRTRSFLDTALSLRLKGPSDFSSRLNDYLCGEKKFDE